MMRIKYCVPRIVVVGLMFAASLEICLAEPEMEVRSEEADKALLDAAKIMELMDEPERLEKLPVSESSNDGYWWIKQNEAKRLVYVKQLIKIFDWQDKGLKPARIVEKLDLFYDPVDDPIDIKMDISLERAFNRVAGELQEEKAR